MVEYRHLDATYDALANPVRRQILAELGAGERRVTDLAAPFEVSLAAVSKHIRQLEQAGLVKRRVAGRDHWLRLEPGPLAAAEAWIAQARRFWEGRLDALAGLLATTDASDVAGR